MFSLMGDLAGNMGSTLAELCQVMILAGSIFEYIRFEDAAHRGELVSVARMNKLVEEVDPENPFRGTLMLFARAQSVLVGGRTRNRRHIEGSELMKVRLPPSFVSKVDLYAKLTKASRSAILSRFFDKGLLLYMRSQRALMRAVEAMRSKEHDEHEPPRTAPTRSAIENERMRRV